jgi:hypothetical protein
MPGIGRGASRADRRPFRGWLPWLAVALGLLAARPLLAGGPGWYAGAAAGLSIQDLPASFWIDTQGTTGSVDNKGLAYDVYAGYRLLDHLALEVGYLHPADTRFSGQSDGIRSRWVAGRIKGWASTQGVRLEAVGLWPLGQRTELYAKGGLYAFNTESDYLRLITSLNNTNVNAVNSVNPISQFEDDGVAPIGGLGFNWRAWRDWRVAGEWQYTAVHVEKRASVPVHVFLLGVSHPFP